MTPALLATLALAALALALGASLRRALPMLARLNVPGPVLGGLAVALAVLAAARAGWAVPAFDTTLQRPLLVAFFTTIGFGASAALLRAGGPQVLRFLALALVLAVVQALVGIAVATGFGLPPAFGVLAGPATLAGGPATGLAFAPAFEAAGLEGAATIAVAAAMAGIVLGGLVGGPIAAWLVARHRLSAGPASAPATAAEAPAAASAAGRAAGVMAAAGQWLVAVLLVLAAMWAGRGVSAALTALGLTLPEYVGAMLAAALARNVADRLPLPALPLATIDTLGRVTLALFLALALMSLDLGRLAGLALPLVANLAAQLVVVALACGLVVWRAMGRDYDAAVMSGGFAGFMLGTTANAMAVMRAVVERHGPAPRAFLVAPLVGAFFIDFTNALVITAFLNLLGR